MVMTDQKVADVMTRGVFAVAPDTSLETASRMLVQHRVSGAPVVSAEGKAVGVVSLFDLVDPDRARGNSEGYSMYYRLTDGWAQELSDGLEPGAGRVEEVMTRSTLSIESSANVEDAGARMLQFGVHRLLVEDEGMLVGIVSMADLLRAFIERA